MPPKKSARPRAKSSARKTPSMSMSGGSAVATQTMVTTAVEIGTATLLVITVAVVSFMLGLSLAAAGIMIGQLVKQPTFQYTRFNNESYEVGRVDLNYVVNDTKQQWRRVDFTKPFNMKPVVFTQVVTIAGAQPVHARLRNVTNQGFDVKIEEWQYMDRAHGTERIHFLAVLPGNYNGYAVGSTPVSGTPKQMNWMSPATSTIGTPIILAQVQTANDQFPVITRSAFASSTISAQGASYGFTLSLSKEEALATSTPTTETVGYLVATPALSGITVTGSDIWEFGVVTNVTQAQRTIGLQHNNNQTPFIFAGMNSMNGTDPAYVRAANITATAANVWLEEEQSKDAEVNHVGENVGYLAIFLPRAACGNGVKESGESCDDGNLVNGDRCNSFCQVEPYCGDGEVQSGEQCDDRNNVSGDGCSATCILEVLPTSTSPLPPPSTTTGTSTGQ